MSGWNESAWFTFALSVALKSTLVLGVAWLAALLLRGRSAATRHLVWIAAAVAVLVLPFLAAALPALDVGDAGTLLLFTTNSAPGGNASPAPAVHEMRAAGQNGAPAGSSWNPKWPQWLLLIWISGMAVAGAQLVAACGVLWRTRRRARPFADRDLVAELCHSLEIGHNVDVFETARSSMPMTFGFFRPAVFLPEAAADWPEERRRLVLLHELAHVRRGDAATHWVARLAVSLHWWNPLAWMAWRASLKERERAADDLVLEAGARASEYATELLEVARTLQSGPAIGWAAIAMARPSQLEGRLLAILNPEVRRKAPRKLAGAAATLLAVALVAPLAAVHAQNPSDPAVPPDVDATIRAANSQKNHEMLDQAAKAAAAQGQLDLARKFLDASVAIREQVSGPNSVDYGTGLIKLGELAQRQGHREEATSYFSRAIQAIGERPEAAPALLEMGVNTLAQQHDSEPAFGYFQRAASVDPAHAERALMWMAVVRARQNETAGEAEVLFQRALAQEDLDPLEKAATLDLYAGLLRRAGRTDEADALEQQAAGVRKSAERRPSVTRTADGPGGVYRVGNGVTSPVPIARQEPEYSEEARLAKYSGAVTVQIEIGPDGVPFNIQVVDGLGLGLDEKAVEAVMKWRFKPGTKDGVPVTVMAQVQVNFRLL